jgi:Uma2 family endonuclease
MPTTAVRRRRWTRTEYDRVIDAGGFGPEDRIELLDGELWEMTPQGSRHAVACELVMREALRALGENVSVRVQSPIALDEFSEPEPDIAVVRGSPRDFVAGHPQHFLILIEVSESSLSYDRGRKLAAYARNTVPEYWVIDLTTETVEVYRDPRADAYTTMLTLRRGGAITPLHAPNVTISVDDILP